MELTHATFAPHVGAAFLASTQAGDVPLILREVKALPRGARPQQFRDPLSLIFEGPDHIALLQDNYPVRHPDLGEEVFTLVPIAGPIPGGNPDEKRLYETIFN